MQPSLSSINEGLGPYGRRKNRFESDVGPGRLIWAMSHGAEAQPAEIVGQHSEGSTASFTRVWRGFEVHDRVSPVPACTGLEGQGTTYMLRATQ
jgi:hypothetical protein